MTRRAAIAAIFVAVVGGLSRPAPAPAATGVDGAVSLVGYTARPTANGVELEIVWRVSNQGTVPLSTQLTVVANTEGSAVVADAVCQALPGDRIFACGPQLSLTPGESTTVTTRGTGRADIFAFGARITVTGDVDLSNNGAGVSLLPPPPPPAPPVSGSSPSKCDAAFQRMIVQTGAFSFPVDGVAGRSGTLVGGGPDWVLGPDGVIRGTALRGQGTFFVEVRDGKCPDRITVQFTASGPAPVVAKPAGTSLDACGFGRPAVAFGLRSAGARALPRRPRSSRLADLMRAPVSPEISTDVTPTETTAASVSVRLLRVRRTEDGVLLVRVREGTTTVEAAFPSVECLNRARGPFQTAMLRARAALVRACGIPPRPGAQAGLAGAATLTAFAHHDIDYSAGGAWATPPLLVPVVAFAGTCTRRAG